MAFLWAFLSDIIHDIETVFLFLFFSPQFDSSEVNVSFVFLLKFDFFLFFSFSLM